MKTGMLMLAALALTPIAVYAHDDAHQGMMPGMMRGVTEGEVHDVDMAHGKLTIKHGAMPKFDMPPMTMAYRVKDKAMLEHLKPGDRIKFDVDSVGGEFTVLHLMKVK